jgi:two-component system, LytTR family, sensor histidine kinase AlgZ
MKANDRVSSVIENKLKPNKNTLFLPDFCGLRMVFSVVIIGELLAFILTMTPLKLNQQSWNDLALISLFIQWNGLSGSSVLCLIRPKLANYSNQFVAIISYLILLLVILLFSELSFFIMEHYQLSHIISSVSHWEFLLHNLLVGGIVCALALHYFYIQNQWRIKMQAENCAKLQLLQARIRPHFLFNSMNSIASLTRTRPEIAERMTEDLAELFRILFKEDHELIPWSHELHLSERYIEIEKQRLSDRLCVDWQIKAIPDDAMVPALLLQPLLENAIFHGIEPEINGGTIKISTQFIEKQLHITIENNNGAGQNIRQGNQIALNNIKERLNAHYKNKASIECVEKEGRYFVNIIIPYQIA